MDFYPSVSRVLLLKALDFARAHTEVNNKDIRNIMHAKRTLFFIRGVSTRTTCTDPEGSFEVAIGAFDSIDRCYVVSLFILEKRKRKERRKWCKSISDSRE